MKKYILIILTCLLIPSTVFASTNTYTRTYDDLRVNKSGISVSNSNIGIIMNNSDDTELFSFSSYFSFPSFFKIYESLGIETLIIE